MLTQQLLQHHQNQPRHRYRLLRLRRLLLDRLWQCSVRSLLMPRRRRRRFRQMLKFLHLRYHLRRQWLFRLLH